MLSDDQKLIFLSSQVKKILSPVIKFSTMLVRPVATNKRAFYLMNTTQIGAQLYELQVEYWF